MIVAFLVLVLAQQSGFDDQKFIDAANQAKTAAEKIKILSAGVTAAKANHNDESVSRLDFQLGDTYVTAKKPDLAQRSFLEGLAIARKMVRDPVYAGLQEAVASSFFNGKEYEKAYPYFRDASSLYEQIGSHDQAATDKLAEAGCLADLNDDSSAAKVYELAGDLYGEVPDLPDRILSFKGAANARWRIQDWTGVIRDYQVALPIARSQSSDDVPEILTGLGGGYAFLGQTAEAEKYCGEGAKLAHAAGIPALEANCFNNIGFAYLSVDKPDKALTFFEQALSIATSSQDASAELNVLSNLGEANRDLKHLDKALDYYRKAVPLARSDDEKARVHTYLAICLYQMGKVKEGIRELLEVRDPLLQEADLATYFQLLETVALWYAEIGNVKEAKGFFNEAVEGVSAVRLAESGDPLYQEAILSHRIGSYYGLAKIFLDSGDLNSAFHVIEETKARRLLSTMMPGATSGRPLTAEETKKRSDLQGRCDELQHQLISSRIKDRPAKETIQLEADLNQADMDLTEYEDVLRSRQAESVKSHSDVLQSEMARDMATLLPGPNDLAKWLPTDTALIEYENMAGRNWEETIALVMVRSGAKVVVRPYVVKSAGKAVGFERLTGMVDGFMGSIVSGSVRGRSVQVTPRTAPKQAVSGEQMSAMLLGPALPYLKNCKRLVVCPDGPLWKVPFQAMPLDGSGHVVWDRFEVAFEYSASAYVRSLQVKSEKGRAKPSTKFFAVANPDFGGVDRLSTRGSVGDTKAWLTPLPGTQAEVSAIKAVLGGGDVLSGPEAQEDAVTKEMAQAKYIHLATHAWVDDSVPMLDCLVLASPEEGAKFDGLLTGREIANMHLCCDMTVLSACETGSGADLRGEGLIGLAWALFAAGSPTQVLSQWPVDDAATAKLMPLFYGYLAKGHGKAEALRLAALELRKSYRAPFFWAPFILIGDYR